MDKVAIQPWMVSLHGGHSVEYCDHARDTLKMLVEAAIDRGYRVFGMTEHAPRLGQMFLYSEEQKLGWDVATLEQKFDGYAKESTELVKVYADRITLLRGFEAEVVPIIFTRIDRKGVRAESSSTKHL